MLPDLPAKVRSSAIIAKWMWRLRLLSDVGGGRGGGVGSGGGVGCGVGDDDSGG